MKLERKSPCFCCLVLALFLSSIVAGIGLAQSPTPLDTLAVALWPEYDRPETLVIFRGRLGESVPLPAQVTFDLPAVVQTLHAIAYLDEAQGTLLNIEGYDLVAGTGTTRLVFTTPGRQFQFEYYSSQMLTIDGDSRHLSFSFTPSADIANLSFEIQQPTTAQAFTSDPPPLSTQARQDGLTYALVDVGGISAGEIGSVQADYTRGTDQLSIETLAGVEISTSPEEMPIEVGERRLQDSLGPILIAVGVLLLTASLIYWFWSQRTVVAPEPAPRRSSSAKRRPPRKRRSAASRSVSPPTEDEPTAIYCHKCGTKFREDARFCHACGAERRAE
jgi:hypothetical protein